MRPIAVHAELLRMPHPCWRTVVIGDDLTLDEVAAGLINLFGWFGGHTDVFATADGWEFMSDALLGEGSEGNVHKLADGPGGRRWAETARMIGYSDFTFRGGTVDEEAYEPVYQSEVRLTDLLPRAGSHCWWTYDMGDSWRVQLTRTRLPAGAAAAYAAHRPTRRGGRWADPVRWWLLLDGDGGTPPDDAGGPAGYAAKLEVLADRRDPDYRETLEWMWSAAQLPWGPDGFDAVRTQRLLDVHDLLQLRADRVDEFRELPPGLAEDFDAELGWLNKPFRVPGYPQVRTFRTLAW